METKVMDMTKGDTTKLLIAFSIPMMIGNIFQQLYNVVDSSIVGKFVGSDALGSIGVTGSVTFLFFAICNGIGSGGGIITAQFFGAGNKTLVKKCISNVAMIMLVTPIIVGSIAYLLTEPLLKMLDTQEANMADAIVYMKINCIGLVFVSVYNYISSMLRALGDTKTPLYFLVVSCLLNVGLDLLFICVFKMGVMGAGIATLISQFVSGLLCLGYAMAFNPYFKLQREDFRFDKSITLNAIKIGLPLSFQFSLIAISCMALQKVINSWGPTAVSAFAATSRIEQVIHQPYQTLGTALSTYTGQNYGANKRDRIEEGYLKGMFLMIIFSIIMFPVMQIFGRQITSIFVNEAEVIEMGARGLKICSYFYAFLGVIYVIRGVLNGLGDALFAMINGGVEVIGRFIVPVQMTGIAAIGVWGLWWSVGVVWFFSGFTAWLRYISYKKKNLDAYTGTS